jgi:hypothetical protein
MKISEERRKGYQWAGDYGSAILGTENAYLEALARMDDNYVPPPPPPAMCGNDTCKTYIDGVDFIDIQGVKETTNTGFVGEGYANVDNSTGSYVTYGVTAFKEGKYTLFISFANGGGSARGYSVSAGDKTLLADGSMESTSAWTTWKVQSIEIELPQGYSELKFTSLSKDGMANIDYIGWMSEDLKIGEVEVPRTSIDAMHSVRKAQPSNRYFVDFSRNANGAGAYFTRGKNTFRVNGKMR